MDPGVVSSVLQEMRRKKHKKNPWKNSYTSIATSSFTETIVLDLDEPILSPLYHVTNASENMKMRLEIIKAQQDALVKSTSDALSLHTTNKTVDTSSNELSETDVQQILLDAESATAMDNFFEIDNDMYESIVQRISSMCLDPIEGKHELSTETEELLVFDTSKPFAVSFYESWTSSTVLKENHEDAAELASRIGELKDSMLIQADLHPEGDEIESDRFEMRVENDLEDENESTSPTLYKELVEFEMSSLESEAESSFEENMDVVPIEIDEITPPRAFIDLNIPSEIKTKAKQPQFRLKKAESLLIRTDTELEKTIISKPNELIKFEFKGLDLEDHSLWEDEDFFRFALSFSDKCDIYDIKNEMLGNESFETKLIPSSLIFKDEIEYEIEKLEDDNIVAQTENTNDQNLDNEYSLLENDLISSLHPRKIKKTDESGFLKNFKELLSKSKDCDTESLIAHNLGRLTQFIGVGIEKGLYNKISDIALENVSLQRMFVALIHFVDKFNTLESQNPSRSACFKYHQIKLLTSESGDVQIFRQKA